MTYGNSRGCLSGRFGHLARILRDVRRFLAVRVDIQNLVEGGPDHQLIAHFGIDHLVVKIARGPRLAEVFLDEGGALLKDGCAPGSEFTFDGDGRDHSSEAPATILTPRPRCGVNRSIS